MLQLDIRFDLALGCERQYFGHIPTGADKRTANGDAVRDNIKQRDRKLAGWQTNQDASTVLPSRANALLECDQGGCRNHNAVSTATGFLSPGCCRVTGLSRRGAPQ